MYKKLFLGMAACAALVACSSDDAPDNPGTNPSGDQTYVAIRLVANAGPGSRAAEGGFENGTSDENKVKDVIFYFYDANGSYMAKSDEVTSFTWTPDPNDNAWDQNGSLNVATTSDVIAVLHGLSNNETPSFLVAVLNRPANVSLDGMSLAQVKALTANVALKNGAGNYVMTNSTYRNGNDKSMHFATEVTSANFLKEKPTPAQLTADKAVTVYVERLAVKATLSLDFKAAGSNEPQSIVNGKLNIGNYNVNGVENTPVNIVIDGWGLNYTNNLSYLFKNVPDYDNGTGWGNFDWWNAPAANFRSYWATSAQGELNKISLLNQNLTSALTNASSSVPKADPLYCMENTRVIYTNMDAFLGSVTSIVVPAHISSVTTGQEPNWYRYAGHLYDETNFSALIVDWASHTYFKDASQTPVDANCFQFAAKSGEQGIVEVKTAVGVTLYDAQGQDANTAANAALATSFANVSQFAHGMMYYNIPIEHLRVAEGRYIKDSQFNTYLKEGAYGVVRNHVYKVAINSIWNLGAPLNNPDPVTPKETTEYYIGATIKILAWHVVSQGVDL